MSDRDFRFLIDSIREALDEAREQRDRDQIEILESRLRIAESARIRKDF